MIYKGGYMAQQKYSIEKHNFTKHTQKTFSSGQYYEIILISKGNCHFEFE